MLTLDTARLLVEMIFGTFFDAEEIDDEPDDDDDDDNVLVLLIGG